MRWLKLAVPTIFASGAATGKPPLELRAAADAGGHPQDPTAAADAMMVVFTLIPKRRWNTRWPTSVVPTVFASGAAGEPPLKLRGAADAGGHPQEPHGRCRRDDGRLHPTGHRSAVLLRRDLRGGGSP
eukprot:CAMPEP_0171262674 /NCGR_PEP_ID=MMETSP0790-20130122/56689_1 /TAXON_ID=2925 /ORGANISM="Alexandrium catenella, Strain OF101" /LENGTH=127 /DNA_ID=CAMNT_0011731235 /DNA_START=212 /DNA_END=592 /DNA_ORIENTATION=-